MADHHSGTLADVWKQLVLAELLAEVRPREYWETHAGAALAPLSRSPEQAYGVARLLERAPSEPALAASPYVRLLEEAPRTAGSDGGLAGSPLLAMTVLGDGATYILCASSRRAAEALRAAVARAGLSARARCPASDGLAVVWHELTRIDDPSEVLVHVDPPDPFDDARPGRLSAIELCCRLAQSAFRVVLSYGYDDASGRAWACRHVARRVMGSVEALWCGDLMVAAARDRTPADVEARIGHAPGPGAGCGVLCANLPWAATARCADLGRAVRSAWRDAVLPNGERGALDFLELSPSAGRGPGRRRRR
jgi:hypothetical protein